MKIKKLMVITGHYGCGKTNLCVNIALDIARRGEKCTVIDLDIVNPYFRTADFEKLFKENGIDIKMPVYANSNLDIPAINIPLESILEDGGYAVIDVGGDDEGAKALGRYAPVINAFGDKEMLYVVNRCRYLTKEPEDAVQLMYDIEEASSLKCTGIVNNTNLGAQTDMETISSSLDFAGRVSELTGLPIAATAASAETMPEDAPAPYPVKIFVLPPWADGKL